MLGTVQEGEELIVLTEWLNGLKPLPTGENQIQERVKSKYVDQMLE